MVNEQGRRERKKAETRRVIADTALRLFLERGYDAVGVREIADTADVAIATLFAHFPSKEALVFDQDTEQEHALIAVVRDRPAQQEVPEALRLWCTAAVVEAARTPELDRYHQLIDATPELRDYAAKMWLRHEDALARAIADASDLPSGDIACQLVAHLTLELLPRLRTHTNPEKLINDTFAFITAGWRAKITGNRRPLTSSAT